MVLIIEILALCFFLLSGISILWLFLININLNSPKLANFWQNFFLHAKVSPQQWGVVYDSFTKKPLAEAIIRMYEDKTGELLGMTKSDVLGRYGFVAPETKFYLRVSSLHHSFPSKNLLGKYKPDLGLRRKEESDYFGLFLPGVNDNHYDNLYFGEIINNKEGSLKKTFAHKHDIILEGEGGLEINIPLDREKLATLDSESLKAITLQETEFAAIKWVSLLAGISLSLIALYLRHSIINLLLVEAFFAVIVLGLLQRAKERFGGRITDSEGKPVSFALIRARGFKTKKIRGTAISNSAGEFRIALWQGWYNFEISRSNFEFDKRFLKCDEALQNKEIHFQLERRLP